jgi:stage III sporulation protein SpoIIIAA
MAGKEILNAGTYDSENEVTSDLDALLAALPPHIVDPLREDEDGRPELVEIVMDLGRPPEARYANGERLLSPLEVTPEQIEYVVTRVGEFNDDNRAGIERTLHRVSCIRNRQGRIVGITCRVGRAVFGTMKIIEDLVTSDQSVLLLGRPGVGKTTMLREIARVLANDFKKRVIIVDTSNEIAGDGDIPHPSLGHARRMQVPQPHLQHHVMIEAVENHMPEVIIIDEIGTEDEAAAARTIAERGVQLIGTAHGTHFENLVMNPTLSDLVGGIQAVTLGDNEARRRRTQKSILERRGPPTFDVVVEIRSRQEVAIHPDVGRTVDVLLRGAAPRPQLRRISTEGDVVRDGTTGTIQNPPVPKSLFQSEDERTLDESTIDVPKEGTTDIYGYGIGRGKLEETVLSLQMPFRVVDSVQSADVVLTTKQLYRRKPRPLHAAEEARVPVYVLRKNSPVQLEQALASIATARGLQPPIDNILNETEQAASRIQAGETDEVELSPQNAYVRRLQHEVADEWSLNSLSNGREPNRRVRIYRAGPVGD